MLTHLISAKLVFKFIGTKNINTQPTTTFRRLNVNCQFFVDISNIMAAGTHAVHPSALIIVFTISEKVSSKLS